MIGVSVAMLLLQTAPIDPRSVNPTIAYTQCMRGVLSGRLRGRQNLSEGERIASFEQSRADCADARAAALSGVDAMLAKMSKGTSPPTGISGFIMMDIWDRALRQAALDPKFIWDEFPLAGPSDPAERPGNRPERIAE